MTLAEPYPAQAGIFSRIDRLGVPYMVVLSADHGSVDAPERLREQVLQVLADGFVSIRNDPATKAEIAATKAKLEAIPHVAEVAFVSVYTGPYKKIHSDALVLAGAEAVEADISFDCFTRAPEAPQSRGHRSTSLPVCR